MNAFRTKSIMVSAGVYEALKAVADLDGMDSPDAVADLKLGLLMSTEADLIWLTKERKKRMDELNREYRERIKNAQLSPTPPAEADDQLP